MTSTTKSGVVVIGDDSFRATVTLSVIPRHLGVPEQQVQVEFAEEGPPERSLARFEEMVFTDEEGNRHILHYGDRGWALKHVEAFRR